MNSLYSVIRSFVVTNKSTDGEIRGVYTCIVDANATKIDIKNAIRTLYGRVYNESEVFKKRQ